MCTHAENTEGLDSTLFQPESFYGGNTPVKFKPRFTNIRILSVELRTVDWGTITEIYFFPKCHGKSASNFHMS